MAMERFSTHDVTNQVAPLCDVDLWSHDLLLKTHAQAQIDGHAHDAMLVEHGTWAGSAATLALGDDANRHPPEWMGYDAGGHRIDTVRLHPAWHALMRGIAARGLHCAAWSDARAGAHTARAVAFILQGQAEAGTLCPTTMTFAALPILMQAAAAGDAHAGAWATVAKSRVYDPVPGPAHAKRGALFGMGLTEKQGGSDLRAITTRAVAEGSAGPGQPYRLTGHKWFFSVPQADAHLVLARSEEGLSCLIVPQRCPDGTRNAVRIRRLKDKLGNRSNASAEVEFEHAWGTLLGEPGHGLAVLLHMAATTRLDCVLGSAALLRRALSVALHHAAHRHAFGHALWDQPAMRNILADAALEAEAAIALGLRLARAQDERAQPAARALLRVGTPAAKLWVCKRAIDTIAECLEVCGGNGYSEDGPMARLYREAPVNSIWEGSGNVMALDVLRAFERDADAVPALAQEWRPAGGVYPAFDAAAARCLQSARQGVGPLSARRLAGEVARVWQAALLIQHAPGTIAAAFVGSRLTAQGGARLVGELSPDTDMSLIIERARLQVC